MAVDVDREELAWAAGFFDGEGTTNAFLRTMVKRNQWTIQLAVSQVNVDTLERFRNAVGVGNIYGPYKRTVRDIYTFKVSGFEKVQAIIAMLWPWLTPHKKNQAALALRRYQSTYIPKWSAEQSLERKRARSKEWARKNRKVGKVVVVS